MNITDKISTRFDEFVGNLNGSAKGAFQELRISALEGFIDQGIPGTRDEEYKYTPIDRLVEKNSSFGHSLKPELGNIPLNPSLEALGFSKLVYKNGHLLESEDNAYISTLSSYLQENETSLVDWHNLKESEKDPFENLNLAFANNGWVINVPKNKTVEKGIIIYHYLDEGADAYVNKTNYFFLGENSEINVIEYFYGPGSSSLLLNQSTQGTIGKSARGSYLKIQANQKGIIVDNCLFDLGEKTVFSVHTISDGPDMVRNNLNLNMKGQYGEGNLYGLFLGKDKKHIDNHTTVDHLVPNCESNELYKGILADHSKGVFNGKIFVRPDAQKTNAFQSNKCILLSDDATINTKPQLEIWADDVKCSHGATTGQLDEEPLFYLRSRGLTHDEARKMLLNAFAIDVVAKISNEDVRSAIELLLTESLKEFS